MMGMTTGTTTIIITTTMPGRTARFRARTTPAP
jgi:hypothetical protein